MEKTTADAQEEYGTNIGYGNSTCLGLQRKGTRTASNSIRTATTARPSTSRNPINQAHIFEKVRENG